MSDDNENEQPLNLDIPDHLEYSEEHAWVDRSVDPAIIGITEYAADQLGELVFVDLPEPGARVEAGDEIVELESSKAVQPLISPVAGTVKYVNRDVADDPSVVNGDPYGEGWLLKVELDDDEPEHAARHGQPLLKARQRLFTKQTQESQCAKDHAHGAGLDGHGEQEQDGIEHHHEGILPSEHTLRAATLLRGGGNGGFLCMFSRGGGLGRRGGNVVFS